MDENEAQRLWDEYEQAFRKVANGGKGLTVREGGVGADAAAGVAYDRLVRAGLAAPLAKKYRVGGSIGARK